LSSDKILFKPTSIIVNSVLQVQYTIIYAYSCILCILYIIYWTIISASAPRGGATQTLLITLNFIDLTNCNNCVYGFYSKFGWFINDCKTHGFLMNFTRMESKSESPRICLRTKIPARNYISTEMNPPSEYSANYLICRTWVVVKKIQQQKHFCSVNDRLRSSSQFQICSVSVNFQVRFKHPLLYPNAPCTYTRRNRLPALLNAMGRIT